MYQPKKRIRLIKYEGDWWFISDFTGEICEPWNIVGIFQMIVDFFRFD